MKLCYGERKFDRLRMVAKQNVHRYGIGNFEDLKGIGEFREPSVAMRKIEIRGEKEEGLCDVKIEESIGE